MQHDWPFYFRQADSLKLLAVRAGASPARASSLAHRAICNPPTVPRVGRMLALRGPRQPSDLLRTPRSKFQSPELRAAISMLPRDLQRRLPRIELTDLRTDPGYDAWYHEGVITIPTYTDHYRDPLRLSGLLVHEYIHHCGGNEDAAYTAEIAWLRQHHAPRQVITDVEAVKADVLRNPAAHDAQWQRFINNSDNQKEEAPIMFPNRNCTCTKCHTVIAAAHKTADAHIARLQGEIAALKQRDYAPRDPYAAGIKALQEANK
jgi:hypothetical protein